MKVLPPDKKLFKRLDPRVKKAYEKQVRLLESEGTSYTSLNFEPVTITKHLPDPYRHYTFRVNQKYRAFCFKDGDTITVFDINSHKYQ